MSNFELKLPKMGESISEATITTWLKEVGDKIAIDDTVVEVATDKVDSEIPSEVEGILVQKYFEANDVVQVGQTLAVIQTALTETDQSAKQSIGDSRNAAKEEQAIAAQIDRQIEQVTQIDSAKNTTQEKNLFYSPLVKSIAAQEGVSLEELATIQGTGKAQRVTKKDILQYLNHRNQKTLGTSIDRNPEEPKGSSQKSVAIAPLKGDPKKSLEDNQVIEMSRVGKLIARHMKASIATSAHVQCFIEADVTNLWKWRKRVNTSFLETEGEPITFTPVFLMAVAKTLKEYPLMNISVDGDRIIKKKEIHIGMATALSDGNLIVPVIQHADRLNVTGMAKTVNDLAKRARSNKLLPNETQNGTYTVSNVGVFGSIMGTPIINQPQVGIMAFGAIQKVPAVVETPEGDSIGIRHRMFLSHSFDHRVVNGALGGLFAKRVKEHLESWDIDHRF